MDKQTKEWLEGKETSRQTTIAQLKEMVKKHNADVEAFINTKPDEKGIKGWATAASGFVVLARYGSNLVKWLRAEGVDVVVDMQSGLVKGDL